MDVDILVIGAGLSGLHTAYELEKLDHDYLLVEARKRLGGRVLSQDKSPVKPQDTAYDIGYIYHGKIGLKRSLHLVPKIN